MRGLSAQSSFDSRHSLTKAALFRVAANWCSPQINNTPSLARRAPLAEFLAIPIPHRQSPPVPSTEIGEGRGEEAGQQSEPSQRSGGVSVGSTSASSAKVSWENSGGGPQAQPRAQAGRTSQAGGGAGEVGVLRSSGETPVMGVERRRDTCSGVRSDGGRWLRKEIRRHDASIINPDFGSRPQDANRTGLGEPNMGKPSVRFDEGRSGSAGLTTAVSSKPPPTTSPTLLKINIFLRCAVNLG